MPGICTYKDNKFMSKIYFLKKIKIRYLLLSAMCLNSGLNDHSSLRLTIRQNTRRSNCMQYE